MLLAVALGGCAVSTKFEDEAAKQAPSFSSLMLEATSHQQAGQGDKAVEVLRTTTRAFPVEKAPWVKMAQIRFDAGNYGEAIVNALEALQRDPKDVVANSLVAVSGLRLSTKALADLRTSNELSGNVRTEAQELAKVLRENVGEAMLVPSNAKTGANSGQSVRPSKAVPRSTKGVSPRNQPVANDASGTANPFGALK